MYVQRHDDATHSIHISRPSIDGLCMYLRTASTAPSPDLRAWKGSLDCRCQRTIRTAFNSLQVSRDVANFARSSCSASHRHATHPSRLTDRERDQQNGQEIAQGRSTSARLAFYQRPMTSTSSQTGAHGVSIFLLDQEAVKNAAKQKMCMSLYWQLQNVRVAHVMMGRSMARSC